MSTKNQIKYFKISGHFKNKGQIVKFSRNIRSLSEADAKEKIFLHFGANHHIKRLAIKFDSVTSVKEDDNQVDAVLSSSDEFKYIKG